MPMSLKDLYQDLLFQEGQGRQSATALDPLMTKFHELLYVNALDSRASDIHLEPLPHGVRIRYRIDGVLQEMLMLPEEWRDQFLRAVKVKANLSNDPTTRSRPQDGSLNVPYRDRDILLRLSTFPTVYGDKIAMRVLQQSERLMPLEELGMDPHALQQIVTTIHRSFGLFLVVGPSNNGKSTTLYAMLDRLRSPLVNIVTLEDPVEYRLDGVNQGQINPKVGLTFAEGLRAILRQDPNVIFIGEMRDPESAGIAVRVALTGHMVFSTLHTKDSTATITRLLDMGVEPYLIISAISGVLAQRLLRKVCVHCRQPTTPPDDVAERVQRFRQSAHPAPTPTFFKAQGCPECQQTGYAGRIGVFELLLLDDVLSLDILRHEPSTVVRQRAIERGLRTLRDDGLDKATQGITTLDEVLRVTEEW